MTLKLKQNFGVLLKEYLLITLGLGLYVGAWAVFLVPNNFVGGGISGISAVIHYATNGAVGIGTMYFTINVLLLIAAWKVLGTNFSGKTIYAVIFASTMLNILPPLIPRAFIQEFVLANGRMICALLGGSIAGLGIGITISMGGSTGGTDIIALMINKHYNISPGKLILLMDVIIISSILFIPNYDADGNLIPLVTKVATVAYGFIMVTLSGYCIDLYISGAKQSVQVLIFSKKYAEIADAIVYDFNRGVTILHAQGWYTKKESEVLVVVTRKSDLSMLMRYIKAIDPKAFLSVSTVMGVYGEGFDVIKEKAKERLPRPSGQTS